jgi:hypothetical protein
MDKLSSFFKFYVDVLQLYFRLEVPRKFIGWGKTRDTHHRRGRRSRIETHK